MKTDIRKLIKKSPQRAKTSTRARKPTAAKASTLMVRLDVQSKLLLSKAAALRHISVSDYVRIVLVPQAQQEVNDAASYTIRLSAADQLKFWNMLKEPPRPLTPAQIKLGKIMRGEM